VNYSPLKDGASSFNGNCLGPRIPPRFRTNVPSTSSNGSSCRQYPQTFGADVLRRVDVSVVVRITMSARPCPNIERHLVADRTAFGARLGTRIPAAAFDERLTGACGLVFDEAHQHAPSRVSRGFRETVVRHDPLHIQILDHDDLIFAYEPMTEFVKMVASGARNTLMRSRYQLPGFVPAVRSFLLAGERPLFALQVFLRLAQVAGVLELRSVAGDGEVRQPNIDADGLSVRRNGGQRLTIVGQDSGMELPARIAADRHGFEFANDLAMHDALHPANLRQIDAGTFDFHSLRILDRLAPMFGLEAGVSAAPGKEILERPRQVLQRRLQRLAVRVTKPLELLFQLRKPDRHRVIVQPLARGTIEITRQGECVVPRPPRTTELNGQRMGLFIGRIEADSGCAEHQLDIYLRSLRSKGPYIPALNGGVLRLKRIISQKKGMSVQGNPLNAHCDRLARVGHIPRLPYGEMIAIVSTVMKMENLNMDHISVERVKEVETLKNVIGWSWMEVSKRVGWGPPHLQKFRALKGSIDERWLQYLRIVAEAVASVPVPNDDADEAAQLIEEAAAGEAGDDVAGKLLASGFHPPAGNGTEEVRVMLMDDIAKKIAEQYLVVHRDADMNPDERSGARWAIGKLAEAMGVAEDVRRLLGALTPTPKANVRMPPPPPRPAFQPPNRIVGALDDQF
jgi:hypothetical protein